MARNQELFDKIGDTLGVLVHSMPLNDENRKPSNQLSIKAFYAGLLSMILHKDYPGIRLGVVNRKSKEFPASDLADIDAGIAVRIISNGSWNRINDAVCDFWRYGLHNSYRRLIIVIIGQKPEYKKRFCLQQDFNFDFAQDVWDLNLLYRKIKELDNDTLYEVDGFLSNALSSIPKKKRGLRLPFVAMETGFFVGRERELLELAKRIADRTNRDPVFVTGLGGMGKTELVARFCKDYHGGRSFFVRFRGNFTDTITFGVAAGIEEYAERKPDPERDYYEALDRLSNCSTQDILVIDNVNSSDGNFSTLAKDPAWKELRQLSLRLIITTRYEIPGAIRVGNMENQTMYRFFENQELVLNQQEMDSLINAVNGHTLTVDLIARTLRRSRTLTVEKMLVALEADNRSVNNNHSGLVAQDEIYFHLQNLFNVAEITTYDRDTLRNMTLLPETGLSLDILKSIMNEAGLEALESLIDHGWLGYNEDTRYVTIHPVVRMVCRTNLKPDDKNCGAFLHAVTNLYDPNQYDAVKYRQFAELFSKAADILPDEGTEWATQAGVFWNQVGLAQNAMAYEVRAVKFLEETMPDSAALSTVYSNLSMTYSNLGDFQNSLEYARKALHIREKPLSQDDPDLAIAYGNLGSAYSDLGNHQQALKYHLKALAIKETVLPPDHPSLTTSYNNVGSTYSNLGDHKKALEYALKALSIREKVLPPEHPSLATSYNNVGSTYSDLGDHKKALEYALKALSIREKVLPPDHPSLATSYNNVGNIYSSLGIHKNALAFQMKALEIQERVLPPEHPHLASSYGNVGMIYGHLGDHKKALEYKLKDLSICEKVLPPDHPHLAVSYGNVGYTYGCLGNHSKALEYQLKALAIREKALMSDHPDLAISYNNVGFAYGNLGDYSSALKYQEKALEIYKRTLSADHPNIAATYNNIGFIYGNLGDHKKALDYQKKALKIREKILPSGHPTLAQSYNSLGAIYCNLHNYTAALEFQTKALSIRERVLPPDHPDISNSYNNLAYTYIALGEYETALNYFYKAMMILERSLPEGHLKTISAHKNIQMLEEWLRERT